MLTTHLLLLLRLRKRGAIPPLLPKCLLVYSRVVVMVLNKPIRNNLQNRELFCMYLLSPV
jgi:hypothetical protein